MPRSGRRKTAPLPSDKRVAVVTPLAPNPGMPSPADLLDPHSEAAITAELDRVQALRSEGQPKPASVSWGDWLGPKRMKPSDFLVAQLAATGMRPGQIAHEVGLTPARLSMILGNSLVRAYINKLQAYYTSDAKLRFERLVPQAIGVYEDVLSSPQEASKLKVEVADKVLTRQWGRPAGDATDSGGTVLNLLRALKELQPMASPSKTQILEGHIVEKSSSEGSGSISDLLTSWSESDNSGEQPSDAQGAEHPKDANVKGSA